MKNLILEIQDKKKISFAIQISVWKVTKSSDPIENHFGQSMAKRNYPHRGESRSFCTKSEQTMLTHFANPNLDYVETIEN